MFGCKFDENGKVTLDIDKDANGDKQLAYKIGMFPFLYGFYSEILELFEERSRIVAGQILCAIKVGKVGKMVGFDIK